ncbi:DUF1345 domain-containing protein [Longispora sp. K20-0274]|uniref:DUF1345 domain-containing protein n=1 Tax=Longispora sp. K20-0274 TaxID=3088255 RepID=UPI00399C41D4
MATSAGADRAPWWDQPARVKLLVSLVVGLLGGGLGLVAGAGASAALIAWDVLAAVFSAWIWWTVWGMDPTLTASHARREDPGREAADLVLVVAALASLVAVAVVLFGAGHADGSTKYLQAGFAVVSVVVSWVVVHTVYTLKYARLYYTGVAGGIDFNEDDEPQYTDFAYLSFTVGMTFQVSDTNLGSKEIRRTALHHAWLSFPLGTVIIAATINLIAGLAT